ncbi:hypothetical protein H0H87_011269, partial [Tephrocybe sp. NHM501043]
SPITGLFPASSPNASCCFYVFLWIRKIVRQNFNIQIVSTQRVDYARKAKVKTIDASQPAFKPRKVKKTDGQYRDRAAERRGGEEGDYAQVEAVLEDFQKRSAGADKATVREFTPSCIHSF